MCIGIESVLGGKAWEIPSRLEPEEIVSVGSSITDLDEIKHSL